MEQRESNALSYEKIEDYYYFYNLDQLKEFKELCVSRFGVIQPIRFVNEPDTFPSLLTYCFINDAEGPRVAFKCLNYDQIKICANFSEPHVLREKLGI